MNELGAVGTAVQTVLMVGACGSLIGTANIYGYRSPQGAAYPYVVHYPMSDSVEYSSSSRIVTIPWFVGAIDDRPWPAQACLCADAVDRDMHDASLSITGGTLLRCRRQGGLVLYQDGAQVWHVGRTYRIEFVRSLGG